MKKLVMILLLVAIYGWWTSDSVVISSSSDVKFRYQVEYPAGGSNGRLMPMLIALHGNGGKANNLYTYVLEELEKPARVILIKAPIEGSGDGYWPYEKEALKHYGAALDEAAKTLASEYPTTGKPALLGYSGGGKMAYYQAIAHGDTYSYIFPVSGSFNKRLLPDLPIRTGVKVYAFHGKADRVVGFGGGVNAVKILNAMGVDAALTANDGGHHIIFRDMKKSINQLIDEKLSQL